MTNWACLSRESSVNEGHPAGGTVVCEKNEKIQEMNILAKFHKIWPSVFRGSDWKVNDGRTPNHWPMQIAYLSYRSGELTTYISAIF